MKLILGLGNPEDRYKNTRHNVGFRILDEYAAEKGAVFQPKEKFRAQIAELSIDGEKVILAKPTTYYNLVGESARAITDFYKIPPQDVLIVHDELALPFGVIRTRVGGSDAGNNGIKSLSQHLGDDTARLRFGIYNDLRDRIDDADFVLAAFMQNEESALQEFLERSMSIVDDFCTGRFEATTKKS